MKPFLTNKENLENHEFMHQDKGNVMLDESILVKTFNELYVSIVGKWCGLKPTNISQKDGDINTLKQFIQFVRLLKIIKL